MRLTRWRQGRAVAVVDPRTAQPETLAEFHRRGVRGLRVDLYSPIKAPGGDTLEAAFAATAEAAGAMGWHVQVIAPLPVLLAKLIRWPRRQCPSSSTITGSDGDRRPDSAEGHRLLDLVAAAGGIWIKLSAPYRHDRGPLNTRPDSEWLAALIAAAPNRCVWGSDWPHPPAHEQQKDASLEAPYRALSYETLVDEFVAALPSPDLAERISGDNATRLYGF